MKTTRTPEYRADEIKTLVEKKGALAADMQALIEKSRAEVRAMTDEENASFDAMEKEIQAIERTLDAERRAMALAADKSEDTPEDKGGSAEAEERAFDRYIRAEAQGNSPEVRAGEQNLTMGNNGAIIPVSIVNNIIKKVEEMCPVFAGSTQFSAKGTIKVPVWGKANGTHDITVAYQEEFSELTADSGKFTSVDLTGYLAGALSLIGLSVVNNSDIPVTGFIVNEMSHKIAKFIEKECLIGTSGKASGVLDGTNVITGTSSKAITADDLIELQAAIPTVYQANACWTMHPSTFTALKKLKDSTGMYLLQRDITSGFPYVLLGKPVYLSDNMPVMGADAKAVVYGDYSGLATNMRQNIDMQVLREKYATQHALGIVAWLEFDSKIIDNQKLAVFKMGAE